MAQTSNVQLKKGKQYQAQITLSGVLQRMATNKQVADKFKELGFSDVESTGNGTYRIVKGTWNAPDTTIALPDQVSNVREPVKSLV